MNSKRKTQNDFPEKVCQYGADCYRKNPIHFSELSHPHLENILVNGRDSVKKQYIIPDELFVSKDVVIDQLKLLEKIFPSYVGRSAKSTKMNIEDNAGSSKIVKPEKETEVSELKAEMFEDDFEEAPKVVKKEESGPSTPSTPSSSQSASSSSSSSVTLFAERRKNLQKPVKVEEPQKPEPSTTNVSLKKILNKNISDYFPVVVPPGKMAKKLEKAAPYNFFMTTITDSKPTHNHPLSVTFQELLDSSLGDLESSVQINFMVDIGWLLAHYFFSGNENKPLLILYGDDTPELRSVSTKKPNVTAIKIQMSTPFGVHHTKMMLLGYTDGSMRVVVSTANLYEDDWHNRSQGIWISPKLPALPEDSDTAAGESPTEFRDHLMMYLVSYSIPKLQSWIARIRKTDFSSVNVCFVGSVPGGHRNTAKGPLWGHPRLGYLLGKHSAPIDDACPIIAQSSSIGSLGPNPQSYILSEIANSFRKDSAPLGIRRVPGFKLIFPSFNNVKSSHDDLLGGGCLPYMRATHEKQPWLKDYLQQWKSKSRDRNQAVPHIKTYCRWSDRGLYWFHLTSANMSKAAWGVYNKTAKIEPPLRINSYEGGVLFLPKFVLNDKMFPMKDSPENKHPVFPMPYDIPLTPYAPEDTPFFMDYLR